jgi:hypothetical protein
MSNRATLITQLETTLNETGINPINSSRSVALKALLLDVIQSSFNVIDDASTSGPIDIPDVNGLDAALSAKLDAVLVSTYGLSLTAALDAAAARGVLGLGTAATSATTAFASASHTHTLAEVIGLIGSLAAKADLVGGIVPNNQLATGTPNESFLLMGNRVWKKQTLSRKITEAINTGTTTNNVVHTELITAGDVVGNSLLEITGQMTANNSAGTKVVRCYFNATADLTGTPILVATFQLTTTTYAGLRRQIQLTSLSSQKCVLPTFATMFNDQSGASTTISTLAINFTTDKYFVVAIQNSVSTDTCTLSNLMLTQK